MTPPPVDLSPLARMLVLALLVASVPLAWLWLRRRGAGTASRLRALTQLTLFLTFDLVVFGAFTRLTDSGLGCPDWPGCYGHASPTGANGQIAAAQAAMPTGPVTEAKAWVEMVHRYFASGVGVLIVVLMVLSWVAWRRRRTRAAPSPWWATLTFAWVCAQGAFGALTVTMKLYPLIVTFHLLGGIGLLALLAVQARRYDPQPVDVPASLRLAIIGVMAVVIAQAALGGWVSTNYAVLACSGFPTCNGQWWPAMDFQNGFTLIRELGRAGDGSSIPFDSLVAIHMVHRIGAAVAALSVAWLAWRLRAQGDPRLQPYARMVAGLLVLQLATGLSNVVLGWPIVAALMHTAGAAALVATLASLAARVRLAQRSPNPVPMAPKRALQGQ